MYMITRKFEKNDAAAVCNLVRRNFLEVNIHDYPLSEMERLAELYDAKKIIAIASTSNMYVICDGDTIVGTGTIARHNASENESILLTIFVLPEYHSKGVGSQIIKALEGDELFLRSDRIEIPASITACSFYEKMGYSYKDGKKTLDEHGLYQMEKFR